MSAALLDQVEVRPAAGLRDRFHVDDDQALTELGIWLSGIESFASAGHQSFSNSRASTDASKELSLVHAALQRCATLTARILGTSNSEMPSQTAIKWQLHSDQLLELSAVLRDLLLLGEALRHSSHLGPSEWRAWRRLLFNRIRSTPAFAGLVGHAERVGGRNLPGPLLQLVMDDRRLSDEHAELALVLPRFGKVLRWLDVVAGMLAKDEPLKPALVIFARVNEQILELTGYITSRLNRFPDAEAEMFASLDAASYTASIELKKVYSQELAGIASIRPSPSIYARVETAHAILNEGFQQILAGFARMIDLTTDIFELFPSFATKRESSLALKHELSLLSGLIQQAEREPAPANITTMKDALRAFQNGAAHHLFYKDTETVERFIEEILITKQDKDLVPILHRFGAYLETLFGQVSLRAVLQED